VDIFKCGFELYCVGDNIHEELMHKVMIKVLLCFDIKTIEFVHDKIYNIDKIKDIRSVNKYFNHVISRNDAEILLYLLQKYPYYTFDHSQVGHAIKLKNIAIFKIVCDNAPFYYFSSYDFNSVCKIDCFFRYYTHINRKIITDFLTKNRSVIKNDVSDFFLGIDIIANIGDILTSIKILFQTKNIRYILFNDNELTHESFGTVILNYAVVYGTKEIVDYIQSMRKY
jgi:hypothetical protein